MKVAHRHGWDVAPAEAVAIQQALRAKVVERDTFGEIRTVAGVDIGTAGDAARAAIVLLSFPDLRPVEAATAERPIRFPYIPGLLAFREVPAILDAFERLQREPDLIMADAQGLAHPRRFGLASHLGVILDKPAIGCAKSRLCGEHAEPGLKAGSWEPLMDGEAVIGAAVRTKDATNVVYVSVGHRICLESAIRLVLRCCTRYRIPEPTRLADRVASGTAMVKEGRQESLF